MKIIETRLEGPLLIEPNLFPDDRGFFTETFRLDRFADLGVQEAMVQHNHSRSVGGTIRGMHFQTGEGVAKLVRCARGRILDVLVDMRPGSPTFGEWEAFELDDESLRTLYAPVGFAHGFCVLSEVADVVYQQSRYYSPEVEAGFSPLDPEVGIDWPVPEGQRIISQRDLEAPPMNEVAP
ncbi:MAG: dTDP-4-dehydrorhamnose 3,5-epimerase [Solirubrobacterales bacterium]